ncbi:hypothetical protein [Oscillatoria sp. HE19RPO]|uniref:hypothetical protein n=1 Tax=Oscillatoria sp. HE19RPO TaxID=2954806 RepID=UPI0020C2164F|nr:hypothetical protein [Oscillatoria sp. HE19RPO]
MASRTGCAAHRNYAVGFTHSFKYLFGLFHPVILFLGCYTDALFDRTFNSSQKYPSQSI